jgi:hypothetical protein
MEKPSVSVELQRLGDDHKPEVNELVARYEGIEAYIDLPISGDGLKPDLLRLAAAITVPLKEAKFSAPRVLQRARNKSHCRRVERCQRDYAAISRLARVL